MEISLKHLSFYYPDQPIFEDFSFSLSKGDFIGVLGPNGCGKTTLLRLMAGILKPHSGEVNLLGEPIQSFSPKERAKRVAMVPQEFDILFPFSALEVVLMGRWPYLKPFAWETAEDIRLAKEAMLATDCLQFADRSIVSLSGGEKERVLMARALAQGSKILLLDEPTTHLDLKHQIEMRDLLVRLNREQKVTLVVVLHDLQFAARACQKILLMQRGKIFKFGPPEEVMKKEFLGEVFGLGPTW